MYCTHFNTDVGGQRPTGPIPGQLLKPVINIQIPDSMTQQATHTMAAAEKTMLCMEKTASHVQAGVWVTVAVIALFFLSKLFAKK